MFIASPYSQGQGTGDQESTAKERNWLAIALRSSLPAGPLSEQARECLFGGQVNHALPAETGGKSGVDPLQAGEATEDRQDVIGEGRPAAGRQGCRP